MLHHRIATRYATGLLSYSQEEHSLETTFEEVKTLKRQLEQSRDFRAFLKSPVIDSHTKERISIQIMKGYSETLLHFVQLMVRQHREGYLHETTKAFIRLYNAFKGIHTAYLTTAVPLNDALRAAIQHQIKDRAPKVELHERIDPAILGGFVLRMGDVQLDQSIATKLKVLRKELSNSAYISNTLN